MADVASNLSDDEEFTGAPDATENGDAGTPGNVGEDEDDLADPDDLFGDGGDDDEQNEPEQRKLDDEELDSGDDEGRYDRAGGEPEMVTEQATYNFMDAEIARHAIPEPSDGELYLLKMPQFLAIEPTAFNHKTFQPPTTDHHSKGPPSNHFSAFNTAVTTIRWRRSPSDHSKFQSNARILRWSDGSLTLQHANDPLNQYEINANMLAPPQINPKVPTPTMEANKNKAQTSKESYTYLVAPYEEANVFRITNKITTGLSILPTSNTKDTALEKLQSDLAMAASRGRDSADQAISFIDVNEDPELRRQREEQQYKEKLKQQRAREKHAMREQERNSRAMNRGTRSGYGGGLDIDMLEGEGGGRRGPKKPRVKSSRHQDWSDEDEGFRGRASKEDDYDEDDDFIAASDEEPEIVEDDDDDDDGIIEEPRRNRDRESPKRNRRDDEDEDDDAEVVVRAKKRRVVQDESDEEE